MHDNVIYLNIPKAFLSVQSSGVAFGFSDVPF